MGHIVSSLHLLEEIIFFFMYILNLIFLFDLYLFIYPYLLNFPQNWFSYFYRGRNLFLNPMFFIGVVISIFYRVELFFVPLIFYFLLTFVAYVFYLLFVWVVFVNTWQKGGDLDEMWEYVEILFVLFRGSWNCFWKGDKINFLMYLI